MKKKKLIIRISVYSKIQKEKPKNIWRNEIWIKKKLDKIWSRKGQNKKWCLFFIELKCLIMVEKAVFSKISGDLNVH